MKKLQGLIRLIRFELPFAAGICVVLGQLFALGEFPALKLTSAGFFSVFFISASILVHNDYIDIETDKINAPHRPIPSGQVTPLQALIFTEILFLAGLFLSYLLSIAAMLGGLILFIVGILYNMKYKKTGLPGNLMVSFSVGMTFVFGGLSVGEPFNYAVLFFALISALIDLGEEIAADAMDAEGDSLINSKSIAIIYGRQAAVNTSVYIFSSVVALSSIPFILGWFEPLYLIPIITMDTAIIYSAVKLKKAEGDAGRKYIRTLYLGATTGLIIFLLMRLAGIQ